MGAIAPRLWPGETFVVIASGPSLTQLDVDACRGHARIIAVNDGYRLAPWADVIYAADLPWWDARPSALASSALLFACKPSATKDKIKHARITVLRKTGEDGLELNPSGLRSGRGNSGYQAVNLARHLGASRIILLGFDMQRSGRQAHFFGSHHPPLHDPPDYRWVPWRAAFSTLIAPLAAEGICVINATRSTALTCFPQMSIRQALDTSVSRVYAVSQ